MSKRIEKLVPFDVNEVLFIHKRVNLVENISKENVPMSSGQFSSIKLKSIKQFNSEHIRLICNSFKEKYNHTLKFETRLQGDIHVGVLSKN